MYQGLQLVCAYFLAPFRILMVRDFWEGFFCHFSQFNPILFDKSSIAKINRLSTVNDVSVGSPSRIRMVLLISFGMTTRPRSSIRLTIPVAFIYFSVPPPQGGKKLLVISVSAPKFADKSSYLLQRAFLHFVRF